MSMFSSFLKKIERGISSATGHHQSRVGNDLAAQALSDSRAERSRLSDAESKANAEKTVEQQRINKKTAASARNSLRRPGFLDSGVEGASDVLG